MEAKHLELNQGSRRKRNPEYVRLAGRRKYYLKRNPTIARETLLEMRKLNTYDMYDRNFRRSLYIRYADDFIILLSCSYEDAVKLKDEIAIVLKEQCGLELSPTKTTITNTKKGTTFLGALIRRRDNSSIFNSFKKRNKITRRSTLRMAVDAPIEEIIEKLKIYKFARRNAQGKLIARGKVDLLQLTHFDILRYFNSKICGILNAYSFAGNFSRLGGVC
jgi:hypothetical protein